MTAPPRLPARFAALEPFVAQWALPTLAARDRARLDSTPEQREAFYHAAGGLAEAALDHLDARPPAGHDAADRLLLDLMLSLIHVALAVEIQGDGEALHARGARMVPITHCHADPAD